MSRAFRFTGMPSACYREFSSVYFVDRIAFYKRLKVGSSHVDQADPGLDRRPGDVGSDDAVGSAEKRISLKHRLDTDNVRAVSAENTAV